MSSTIRPNIELPAGCEPAWIWIGDKGDDRNAHILFRREFNVRQTAGARLFISAETRYHAGINGKKIGEGPPHSLRRLMYHDTHDISRFVKKGLNCLAIMVQQIRPAVSGKGGLWTAVTGAGDAALLLSEPGWRCIRAPQWNRHMLPSSLNAFDPFQESFDANKEPARWMLPGFDDRAWHKAEAVPDAPWSRPVARDIPPMLETPAKAKRIEKIEECIWLENRPRGDDLSIALSQVGKPLKYAQAKNLRGLIAGGKGPAIFQCSTAHLKDHNFDGIYDPCVVLDFGKVITAYIEIDLEGPEGGIVDAGVVERLIDGNFNNSIECQFASRYIMKQGRQRWRSLAWRGFRYLKLRIRKCQSPLRIHSAAAVVTTYPYEERGAFACGDRRLNKVFEICRYTLRLCSNEFLMDTPWREQAQWLGDISCVVAEGLHSCFGDVTLTGKFMRQSAVAKRPEGVIQNVTNRDEPPGLRNIPDYSLWWVMNAWRHYLYSGNRQLLESGYPTVRSIIDAVRPHIDADGLIRDMPLWVFIDWAFIERRGECTAFNAIFAGALDAAARIATELGQKDQADDYARLLAALRANFTRNLFDKKRGVFSDANIEGKLSPRVSEHANMTAVLFGLCGSAETASIITKLYEKPSLDFTEATPFYTTVVLRGLDAAGRFDLAIRIIRDRWGKRMVDRGFTSVTEEWGQNGSWREGFFGGFLRSNSHAWSAGPADFLIRNLAGIEIIEPGCRAVRVAPKGVDFDYDITYPTPAGSIRIIRKKGRLTVSSAPGMRIERG